MSNTQERPLYFSLDLEPQDNEMFIPVAGDENYQVSNLGRIKSLKKSKHVILSPYRIHERGHLQARLSSKMQKIKDIMFLSFFGAIEKGLEVQMKDKNPLNLNIKNLILVDPEEIKIKRKKANEMKTGTKPYSFTKSQKTQKGEIFKPIKDLEGRYEVSNIARVRRLKHTHNGKDFAVIVLSPQIQGTCKDYEIKILGVRYSLKDLVFDSFIGLASNQVAATIDKDFRNLHIDNLGTITATRRVSKYRENNRKVEPQEKKPKTITVDINDGYRDEKIKEMQLLKITGYCLVTMSDGVYLFRRIPKEGELVRIAIKGAKITAPNRYKVKTKDGLKYYLEGVDPVNYFFASELELV